MVFIFEQLVWDSTNVHFYEKEKERHNQEVSAALERAGYNVNGIDLWIGIYRPDRPFA